MSDAHAGYEKVEELSAAFAIALARYYLEAIPLDSGKK